LMSLEMVGSRILAPTFGSSIYIWGALIVIVMAALTLGYYFGGRYADRFPSLLMMGVILTGAGIWVGLLPFWTTPVSYYFTVLGPRLGSLMAALAFFFVPSVLLATISPFAIKLTSDSLSTIGNTAGRLSAVSSAGSIVGTFLTSFFLIPLMGVRNIVLTQGLILLGLAFLVLARQGHSAGDFLTKEELSSYLRRILIIIIVISLLLLGIFGMIIPKKSSFFYDQSQILYERDSLYHHILVAESGSIRNLHFDNSYQSAMDIDNPLEMVFDYTSYLHLGVVVRPNPERVLFIGLGGGSTPKKFLNDYPSLKQIDVVEIDPEVAKVAYDFFNLPNDPKLRVSVEDGRLLITKKAREIAAGRTAPYDLVVIDAYSESTIPYHLSTLEFLEATRKVLSPEGVVVSNIIGALSGTKSRLLYSMTRTFMSVFPQAYLFPVGYWDGSNDELERNVILVATMNQEFWNGKIWQDRAEEFQEQGFIKEEVANYVKTVVNNSLVLNMIRNTKVPVLTDNYAPVDTLQHPLL
ncbi:MAG: spermidine synthase, partial [Bacteroidota bacterium]